MTTYLIRFAEVGRERQPGRRKLRRDLAAVIRERLPDAVITEAPGRLIVDAAPDLGDVLASLPGVLSVSPCERVSQTELETAALAVARRRLGPGSSFAVRVQRGGSERRGVTAAERSPDVARRLGDRLSAATGARVDLSRPDVVVGIELRGDEAFVFDRVLDGVDRAGPTALRAPGEPRFVADQMLGRLAARLRLLGYDTLTVYDIADSTVTRLCAAEGRILLTRDGALARTRAVPVHRVVATDPRAQLAEVLAAFVLTPDPARLFSRCTLCNTLVEPVAETDVHEQLPPGIRGRALSFFRCPTCAHIYWRGSHVTRILADLRAAGVAIEP